MFFDHWCRVDSKERSTERYYECEQHTSHVTFSRRLTSKDAHKRGSSSSLACAVHISNHSCVVFMRSCCVFDSPRLFHFPLSAVYLLFYRLYLLGLLQQCGGKIPCALLLMRTLAPLPSTTLSQVMIPTTTTSRRPPNRTSRNPSARAGS